MSRRVGDFARRLAADKLRRNAKYRNVQFRHIDAPYFVSLCSRRLGVALGQRMVEMSPVGIGMSVDNRNLSHTKIVSVEREGGVNIMRVSI